MLAPYQVTEERSRQDERMAKTSAEPFTWGMFLGLSGLFALGNLIFVNLLLQLIGFAGILIGMALSGLMTILVHLYLVRRKAGPAESIGA